VVRTCLFTVDVHGRHHPLKLLRVYFLQRLYNLLSISPIKREEIIQFRVRFFGLKKLRSQRFDLLLQKLVLFEQDSVSSSICDAILQFLIFFLEIENFLFEGGNNVAHLHFKLLAFHLGRLNEFSKLFFHPFLLFCFYHFNLRCHLLLCHKLYKLLHFLFLQHRTHLSQIDLEKREGNLQIANVRVNHDDQLTFFWHLQVAGLAVLKQFEEFLRRINHIEQVGRHGI
jgi:hypothetical protein